MPVAIIGLWKGLRTTDPKTVVSHICLNDMWNSYLLAKPFTYHQVGKNCINDPHILHEHLRGGSFRMSVVWERTLLAETAGFFTPRSIDMDWISKPAVFSEECLFYIIFAKTGGGINARYGEAIFWKSRRGQF